MTKVTKLGLVALLILSAAQAHAAPLQMPRIVQGEWCYLGNLPQSKSGALYAPCSEGGGGGCEDVTINADGLHEGACQQNLCRPKSINLTMYGYEIQFTCDTPWHAQYHPQQLFNFIAHNRLVITNTTAAETM
jgi:hypothetical protein